MHGAGLWAQEKFSRLPPEWERKLRGLHEEHFRSNIYYEAACIFEKMSGLSTINYRSTMGLQTSKRYRMLDIQGP